MKLNGCNDPNWEDGANMNLVRNHIYYYKQKILEQFGKDNLPEIYFREDPPEVEEEYMAKADLIKKLAPIRLAEYKANENFKRLQMALDVLDEKTIEKLFIDTVVGYASGLELAILERDFVTMRNHALGKGYFEAFEQDAFYNGLQTFVIDQRIYKKQLFEIFTRCLLCRRLHFHRSV